MCKTETYCYECNTDSLEFKYSEWDDYGKLWAYYVCSECGAEVSCDYYYGRNY